MYKYVYISEHILIMYLTVTKFQILNFLEQIKINVNITLLPEFHFVFHFLCRKSKVEQT